jgi:hypothetical protein
MPISDSSGAHSSEWCDDPLFVREGTAEKKFVLKQSCHPESGIVTEPPG